MASNQTGTDAPPPYTTVPIHQPIQQPMQQPIQHPIQQPINQPTHMPNMQSSERIHQSVLVVPHQPRQVNTPRPQVPREFHMNANEAMRANQRIVTGYNNVMLLHPYGEHVQYTKCPAPITCQFCQARVVTQVETEADGAAVCMMILILLLCLPFGICFLLSRNMEKCVHKCPNCKREVGSCV